MAGFLIGGIAKPIGGQLRSNGGRLRSNGGKRSVAHRSVAKWDSHQRAEGRAREEFPLLGSRGGWSYGAHAHCRRPAIGA